VEVVALKKQNAVMDWFVVLFWAEGGGLSIVIPCNTLVDLSCLWCLGAVLLCLIVDCRVVSRNLIAAGEYGKTLGVGMRCVKNGSLLVLGGIVVLGLWTTGGVAASGSSGESDTVRLNEREFKNADQNKDDLLSLAEFDDYTIAVFSALDKNHDKILDEAEQKNASSNDLRALDIDGDKRITFQEVMRASHKNFITADKDHNKKLSLQEVNAF